MERRRGRRSKVMEYGAEKVVDTMLVEGKTYQEVAEAFEKETGEKIALSSVGVRNNRLLEGIRKTKRVEAMVDELIEEVMAYDGEGRDPGEKVAAAARRMLMTQAVEAVSQMGKESFEGLTPEKLAQMVNGLERSRISAEKLKLEYQDGFAAAKLAIVKEVRESFREHPEVMDKVCEIVEAATRKLEERVE